MNTTIFLAGLPLDITGKELVDFFAGTNGIIIRRGCISVPVNRTGRYVGLGIGIAYALCISPEDAAKAIVQTHKHFIRGKQVAIKWSRTPFAPVNRKDVYDDDVDFETEMNNLKVPLSVVQER